ncbi:hypothetical protein LZG00_15835 [Rhodobacteraceae bacterium LMO-12]|nr:hypothetical protein [Rhodobacteraceae bacterium LMO-JJ12]
MTFIPVSRDIEGSMIEAPGGFIVSVFHIPTNRALYGFEHSSEGALGWIYASRLILDKAEGSA